MFSGSKLILIRSFVHAARRIQRRTCDAHSRASTTSFLTDGHEEGAHKSSLRVAAEHAVENIEHAVESIISPEPRRPREVTRLVPARLTIDEFEDCPLEETLRQVRLSDHHYSTPYPHHSARTLNVHVLPTLCIVSTMYVQGCTSAVAFI